MRSKTCKVRFLIAAGLVLAGFIAPHRARADAVVDWNAIAMQAIGAHTPRPGPSHGLDFATVHVAIHDAVQAYDGRFESYAVEIPGATGSPVAAVAKAAHAVLVNRFPAQTMSLDTTYHAYLASHGLAEDDPGVSVGQQAAAAIIARRANDGSNPTIPIVFIGGTNAGEWRPTPPAFASMAIPWMATVTPFTLKHPAQFRGYLPPPDLSSRKYARDYYEVKAMGSLTNSARTPEQTDIAYFFADNAFFYWNRAVQSLALTYVDNIGDSARLFALVNMAMADAPITAWDSKLYFNFWRPVTAIQEGDNDLNRWTVGDPTWLPLIATPPYPDYTSGANNLSGAVTRMLARYFGTDKVPFSLTSNTPQAVQKTRTYRRFSDAAEDVVDARVYLGIHFRFADIVARRQGRRVADWAFSRFLRPLEDCDKDRDKRDKRDAEDKRDAWENRHGKK